MKIRAVCVDDTNKPEIIPDELWPKLNKEYNIVWIYHMVKTTGMLGCDIEGLDISSYSPYNCFRLTRFAFRKEDLPKLRQMMIECAQMNEVDMDSVVKRLMDNE